MKLVDVLRLLKLKTTHPDEARLYGMTILELERLYEIEERAKEVHSWFCQENAVIPGPRHEWTIELGELLKSST